MQTASPNLTRSPPPFLTPELSRKIDVFRSLAILLVIYAHWYNLSSGEGSGVFLPHDFLNHFLQSIGSFGVAKTAVPLFAAMSGYLFFLNISDKGFQHWYPEKIRKLRKTLFIPYLTWNAIGLVTYFLAQNSVWARGFFTTALIRDYTPRQLLAALFLQPVPYQMWFVRDLILYRIVSPLIEPVLRRAGMICLLVLCTIWLGGINLHWGRPDGLLFFCAGGWLAMRGGFDLRFVSRHRRFLFVLWLLTLIANAANMTFATGTQDDPFHKVSILIGVAAVWVNYDLKHRKASLLVALAPLSFFIFAVHEPSLTVVKKLLLASLPTTSLWTLAVYVSAPVMIAMLGFYSGSFLRARVPSFYRILSGDRGLAPRNKDQRLDKR